MAQTVKCLPTTQETQFRSLGQEDPLEEDIATQYSILDWTVPWIEKPGRLQSTGLQRVGYDRNDIACTHTHTWEKHRKAE